MEGHNDVVNHQDIQKLTQELANFIAVYEQVEDKFKGRHDQLETQTQRSLHNIHNEVEFLKKTVADAAEVMSTTGAARWRVSAEQAMQQGNDHVKALEKYINEFRILSEKCAVRLEKITIEAEKRLAKLLGTLSIEQEDIIKNFKRKIEDSYKDVNLVSSEGVSNLKNAFRWFRLERFAIAFFAAICAAFLMGLYVNAEMPWESYKRAAYEREVGTAVIGALEKLNVEQQNQLKTVLKIPSKNHTHTT